MPDKILIIEDEPAIQSILRELLTSAGYEVRTAGDGLEGLALYQQGKFDLVLLDIMLPKLDGYGVCQAIRATGQTPVIMLTALDEEAAQVQAFQLQADDYITKPFSIRLMLLRVEAVLRRSRQSPPPGTLLTYREIRLDTVKLQAYAGARELILTRIEFDLLKAFLANPRRVYTRSNLLNMVWGYDYFGDEKAVNIHIMNLRRKLGAGYIETIRGVGYRFEKN